MNGKATIAIGFMLFALFFGAGNLIFPVQLGQYAGDNLWFAGIGFLLTGAGLPLLGILAMAISGSKNLQELAGHVHPVYAMFFTTLLYLTIGPFFAAPRTGTVAYEVGIAPMVSQSYDGIGLLLFTFVFFLVVLLFSLYPAKLVDNIGKILAPALVVFLGILLLVAIFKPMGAIEAPLDLYTDKSVAAIHGFLEGYNTMDALASLVFGMIVIQAIRSMGITAKKEVFTHTARAGIVAIALLGFIYIGIVYLGATSVSTLGLSENGGPILYGAAIHYFGTFGGLLLAVVITLACLTTAIGLNIATAEYFHSLMPRVSQRVFAAFFAFMTFIVANFGLTNIIKFSIPVLMFLYPLAIVLILLTFLSPLFKGSRAVYVSAIAVTFVLSLIDGVKALYDSLEMTYFSSLDALLDVLEETLPLHEAGLGWAVPVLLVIGIMTVIQAIRRRQAGRAI